MNKIHRFIKNNKRERYFGIAAMPTPNGDLHLGHIAGPFLKMDILKRFNKQLGNEIYIATGTDSYESHVIPEALRNSCTIEETCLTNKKCIQISLEKLSIDVDLFINPSDNKIKDDYTSFLVRMHTKLIKSNFTCKIEHLVPYNSNTKNYITGSSLIGKCPECNNNGSGYYCEVCGMDNPADTLKSSYDKYHPKDQLALVKTDDYYLILDKKHIIDSAKKIIRERYITTSI